MDTIDKIIELLKNNNKSQKDLTDHLGLDKSTFSAWKNKKSKSYNKYLPEIASYLNVTVDYLTNSSDTDTANLKFALFGDTNVDDEVLEDVMRYARIARQMREDKQNKD